MNKSSLGATPGNLRLFTALLLNFAILMTPIAAVAARTERSEVPAQRSEKVNSGAKTGQRAAAKEVFANPAPPVVGPSPIISASMTDSIENDDGDGKIDPTNGNPATTERIVYSTTITNSGTVDATGVQFTDTIDSHTTLDGTLNVSPLAGDDSYDTIGNTLLEVGPVGTPSSQPKVTVGTVGTPKSVFDNDTEFLLDTFTLSKLQATTYPGSGTVNASTTHGSVTMDGSGHFSYLPTAGYTGDDTFTYTIKDSNNLEGVGTVTIHVNTQRVWYVQNNSAGTNQGTSENPFTSLASAQPVANAVGDIIYVFNGNNTTGNQNAGYTIQANNQRLIGEGVQLDAPVSVNGGPNPTVLRAAGTAAKIGNGAGDAVTVTSKSGVIIRGFIISDSANGIAVSYTAAGGGVTISNNSISGGTGNAIDVTSSGASAGGSATISNNAISAAGAEGIDINANGTGTLNLTVDTNTITSTGNGFDVQENGGACNVSFTNNTGITSNASGVNIVRVTGTLTITGFANNQVSGASGLNGVLISNAAFSGLVAGTLAIGSSGVGNGVGGNGLVLQNTTGALPFTSLTVYADGGRGIDAQCASAATSSLTANSGATISAIGGAAVFINGNTIDLQNAVVSSTNSPDNGVMLGVGVGVNGTFSATAASSISNATGDDVAIGSGTASVTWNASLSNSAGNSVDVTGHTSGTISFTGTINDTGAGINLSSNGSTVMSFTNTLTLNTGTNPAFTATGGGTVSSTATGSTIQTTTGTGLNVANTIIGSGGLTFLSINVNGATNGIILNNTLTGGTESSGALSVTGTGTSDGTGGTIQNNVQGALFTSTRNLSLKNMHFTNANSGNGTCNNVDNSTFNSTCQGAINMNTVTTATFDRLIMSGGNQIGINGRTVSGLTITNSTIHNFGDNVNEDILRFFNLTGTCSISNTTLENPGEFIADIRNDTGTLNLTFNTVTFNDTDTQPTGAAGLSITSTSASTITLLVDNSTFTRITNAAFQASAKMTSTMNADFTDNSVEQLTATTGRAVDISSQNSAHMNFNVNHNTKLYSKGGTSVNIYSFGSSVIQGRVNNNTDIECGGVGSPGTGVAFQPQDNSTGTVEIIGNTISKIGSTTDAGIRVLSFGDGISQFSATADATITGNNISLISNGLTGGSYIGGLFGVQTQAGSNASDTIKTCADLQNNAVTATPNALNGSDNTALRTREGSSGSQLYLEGMVAGATNSARALNTWTGRGNTPAFNSATDAGGAPAYAVPPAGSPYFGVCRAPSNPTALLVDPLRKQNLQVVARAEELSQPNIFASAAATAQSIETPRPEAPSFLARAFSSVKRVATTIDSYLEPPTYAADKTGDRDRDSDVRSQRSEVKFNHARSAKLETRNSKLATSAAEPMPSGETVTFDNGTGGITLPVGKSVTLVFKVTLNNLPGLSLLNPPRVSNQGRVFGTNFTLVNGVSSASPNTDDPAPPVLSNGTHDATETLADLFNTTTTVQTSGSPSFQGDSVTFTATVTFNPTGSPAGTPGTPTGTVQFLDGVTPITCDQGSTSTQTLNGSGVATCTTSTLSAAAHTINVNYNGDGNFDISSGSVPQTVNPCTVNPIVTNTNDSGAGSLRDAISAACSNNTIDFNIAGAGPHTITLTTGELTINRNLTITNTSGKTIIVSGGGTSRVFNLSANKTASISNLTVTNGSSNGGGAIKTNDGSTLTLTNMTVSNSTSTGGGGGVGIFCSGPAPNLIVRNSTISGNTSSGDIGGGGLYNDCGGTIWIDNSTIDSNHSTANAGPTYGGGGISTQPGGKIIVSNSTISNNTATKSGGGIYSASSSASDVVLTNTTLSGNQTDGDGGGINGRATFVNTTITNNRADADNNASGSGGGIFIGSLSVALLNTIVSGNFSGSGSTASDIAGGGTASGSFNLIGTGGSGGLTNGVNNNQVGVAAAFLGALANNGGATLTHKLLSNSTAIEAGTDITTLSGNGGSITAVATSVIVADATAIPQNVTFVIQVDSEQMSVTSKSGNTLTVVRGVNGTTAATHNDGAAVNPAFDQRGSGFIRKADSADANTTQTVDIGAYEAHPTIEDIQDTSTNEDTVKNVTFSLGDDTGTLITGGGGSVAATSSNTTLVPNANLSFSGSGGSRTLQITPAGDQSGTTTITVTVTATNGRTAVDSFVLTVNAVNDSPNVSGETIGNIAEDCSSGCTAGKYVIPFSTLLANDNAGPADEQGSQTITITNVGSAVGGAVTTNGTNVEFTPTLDYNGAASFQYTVTDNGAPPASANGTASFTITEVNDPPVATDDSLAGISEDCASGCSAGKYVIPFATLTGNDSKGPANESTQTLTITLVNNAVGGTVAINGTNVEFTPTANFNGTASFDYTVQDNGTTNLIADPKTDVGSVSFPVTAIADTPSVTNSSTNEDTQTTTGLVITINAADGAEVTHFKITNITNGSLFKNDGTTPIINNQFITVAEGGAGLKFTPTANFNGIGSFDVAAATNGSGSGLSGTATAQITVGSIGDVPGVTNATTNEDTQTSSGLVITKNAADGVDITVFKITNITNGTLFQNNGTTPINNNDFIAIAQGNAGLKFTPNANLYSSVSTFSFDVAAAKDNTGAGLGNTATATITVNPIADTPSVSPNPQTTAISTQTGPMVISRNAADGNEVTHFKITNITHGILYQSDGSTQINNNQFIDFATANAGLKFTPTAGLSSPGDDPFSFQVQASTSNGDGGLGGSVVTELINVSCSDPQVVTSTLDDGSAGTLRYAISNSCPNTGAITFNLPAGPQTITLGSSLTMTKTLSITGPTNQAITINGGGSRVFDVTGGSPTIANLTITGAVVSGSNGGGLRNSGPGIITLNGMTFTGNSADNGGGIAMTAGTIVMNNSTISGNTGNTDGGGVWINGGTLTLLNDTVTNNTATAGQGGGLRAVSGTVNVRNTIIAGNTATSNANVGGTINDQGNNILSGNPKLAALANNGGPTMTHALLAGSPALDAGDNTAAASLATDQRGNPFGRLRDAGSDADTTQTVDIGAFEADPSVEDITDKTTSEDTALPTFSFNVGDSFSAFDSITATSSNTTLVPNANVVLSGSGSTRSLSITPAANQFGNTTITVTVTKTVNSTVQTMSDTFVLTVSTVPDTPSITNSQTDEDVQSTFGLVVTKNAADGSEVNNFKIVSVTGGTLFKHDGVTSLPAGSFITIAEGGAGLKFTPAANSDTAGTVTVQASTDNVGTVLSPNSATATITIVPIADTPSVTNATTNEDIPTSSGLVVTRNAADGAEVTHFEIFNITNGTVFKNGGTVQVTNNGFITVAEGNAGLQFRPAANLNSPGNTFSFQVRAATNGAGVGLSSGSATATITVNAANDAPSFTKGADQTVLENSGPQTVNNWATGISAGPSDESGQTLTFQVTGNTNPGLFSAAPAISSTGTLTYTPANNVAGTAQITINLKDNGGTSNGGVDTSAGQTFNITVTAAGFISLSASNYNVNENVGSATVTVNRAGDTSVAMTVDYATSDGTAKSRSDYNSVFGTLRFEVGDTQKTILIPITQDAFNEGPEGFTITLSNPTGSGVNLVVPSAATITISDSPSPTPNAIDDNEIFVRQHYHDFLNREADPAGLAFWVNGLNACNDPSQRPAGQTQAQCLEVRRILTSAAFFLSIEFMQTGTFVRNVYVASLDRPATGNMPAFNEWLRDTQAVQRGVVVGQGNWQATLDANRLAFINDFVMRAEYVGLYPTTDTPTQYVDKLYAHAGVSPANPGERNQAINEFGGAATASDPGARGRALIRITQNSDFRNREFPRAFVQMEYFGYLRRNPNDPPDNNFNGYNFWVNKLIQFNNDFFAAEMVKAFLTSSEYRSRFGP